MSASFSRSSSIAVLSLRELRRSLRVTRDGRWAGVGAVSAVAPSAGNLPFGRLVPAWAPSAVDMQHEAEDMVEQDVQVEAKDVQLEAVESAGALPAAAACT